MTASQTHDTTDGLSRTMRITFTVLAAIERAGNRLPHPFWLFWILIGMLGVASAALSAAGVRVVGIDGDIVEVRNLLSLDGGAFALESALKNYAGFPPMPVVLVVIMGVIVAERSGLTQAVLRGTIVNLPARWVTFSVAFAGMLAHVTFDAAYVILIPMAAAAFRAVGRSGALGVLVAFAGISAGYNASPLITPSDAILAGISTSAAQIAVPEYVVTPLASYFWNAASSVVLAVVLTAMVELLLRKRPELSDDPDVDDADTGPVALTVDERRGLRRAGLAMAAILAGAAALLIPASSPLRGDGGSIVSSVVMLNIAVIVGVLFTVAGAVYGRTVGTVRSVGELPGIMAEGVKVVAPILVLYFVIAQFLAYITWTGLGQVLAVNGADALNRLHAPPLVLLIALIVFVTVANVFITSGSGMWALIAPIVIPMFLLVGIDPEVAQTAYRIGDSCTNAVTPANPFLIFALGYMQRYRKSAGIGTVLSTTVPIALVFLVVWTAMFALWYLLGIPLGPGVPVR